MRSGARIGAGALGAALAASLLLGACGDDDDGADAGGASTSIDVEATEFQFDPDSWTVPAGEEFTVEFVNGGGTQHEWAVIKRGEDIESEADFEEDKVEFEIEATPAGESVTEAFTLEEAGTHQVICALPGHFDAGMEATLVVE
ncbi:MAG TPA: plastocyanin/azurin family copper-binding protein [Acidimicrobiales bacterium]|nr:plastocyanin/azurin family copper-binding protein [Acidimicrobiales bacterium]